MLFRITILLGFAIIGIKASHFRGSFITWTVDKTDPNYFPANYYASVAKVHIKFGASWRRSDGQSYCTNSSIDTCQLFHHGSWSVYYGYSPAYTPYFHSSFTAGFFCEKFSIDGDFVVGSNTVTIFLSKNYFYKIQTSSCCWVGYLNRYSSSSWHVQILPSLQPRPGGSITNLNTPPQIEYLPVFQHKLEHYNHINQLVVNYALPVSDPDNDMVKCRWAANFTEGGGIWNSRLGQLHEHNCSLSLSGYQYAYTLGWYAFAVMVEDFAYDYSLGRYVRLSSIPLQFTVELSGYYRNPSIIYGNYSGKCHSRYQQSININPVATSIAATSTRVSPSRTPKVTTTSTVPHTTSASQALDGCLYYQALTHPDRAYTYSDWSSYRCDRELHGWYRFMGQAGNRMINYCPNSYGSSYRCGSYYQGWIMSGALPSVYDGTVARQVCFSRYGYCTCSYTKSILIRNCGTFHVYWLDSVPSCNSRYCGIRDKSSVVHCSQNYMRIDLDKTYYNASLYSSITLRSASCPAWYSSTHIMLGTVHGSCGSTRKDTANHIVYENEVVLTAKSTGNQLITRNLNQKIYFSCSYGRNGFVSNVGFQPVTSINVTEAGWGNFSFYFAMYKSKNYWTQHSSYPVSVQLRDMLYFETRASISDNSVVLLIDQCYATPTMDRNHYLKYVFINNRCPSDATVKFHATQRTRQRFSIQAFRFLSNSTAAYVHCLVYLCHASSTDSRCTSGCQGNNVYRAKRDVSNDKNRPTEFYMIETSLQLANEEIGKSHTNKQMMSTTSIVVICCGALLAIVIVGLALKIRKMHHQNKVASSAASYQMEDPYKQTPEDEKVKEMVKEDLHAVGVMSPAMQAAIF